MENKLFEECKSEVAKKHRLGSTLVTGHLAKYWQEAAEIYAEKLSGSKTERIRELESGEAMDRFIGTGLYKRIQSIEAELKQNEAQIHHYLDEALKNQRALTEFKKVVEAVANYQNNKISAVELYKMAQKVLSNT